MNSSVKYLFRALLLISLLSWPAPTLADSGGTPVNCEAQQFWFGPDLVLASSGQALFKVTENGWIQLAGPIYWTQIDVTWSGTIFTYDEDTTLIFHSDDGGTTWSTTGGTPFFGYTHTGFYPSPVDDEVFLSINSFWSNNSSFSGLWKSLDGGFRWQHTWDLSHVDVFLTSMTFSPTYAQDGTAFMARNGRGTFVDVWKTTDFGQTWAESGAGIAGHPASPGWLVISRQFSQDSTLFAGSGPYNAGFYKSTDAGEHWFYMVPVDVVASMALSPDYRLDQTVLVASRGKVYKSLNGAASFFELWAPNDKWVGVVGFSYASPDTSASASENQTQQLVYWAVAVEGSSCRLYRSEDNGATWQPQTLHKPVYLPAILASSITND